jgi:COMPASS component SPP1
MAWVEDRETVQVGWRRRIGQDLGAECSVGQPFVVAVWAMPQCLVVHSLVSSSIPLDSLVFLSQSLMASRRLDISSLLCDDNPMPFSPLEALVHAATEEKRRLDQGSAQQQHQQGEHRRVYHPPSIAHLISPDPPISIPLDSPDPRHIKKRRYSLSPSPERIIRERDKMFVGELGYGRVDPVPSFTPRRPGSGHGHSRKHVAVADLLSPPLTSSTFHSRLLSPLGRRSPPGSQIGRAKAARKSDEYQHHPNKLPTSSSFPPPLYDLKKPNKEPKLQQEDPHEWFLQQFDQVPSPTTRLKQPHSPSPLHSPTAPPPFTTTTPVTAAVALEQELEDFTSKPTPVVVKIQEPEAQMDLDVDLAVTELVQTMEADVKPPRIEVDVEDELLSLLDDRLPPSSSTAARRPAPSHSPVIPATASISANPALHRSVSEARHVSPSPTIPMGVSPASAVRHPSAMPTSERGSMPPPTLTGPAKKAVERAGSVVPTATTSAAAKKKKEPKVRLFILLHFL